MVFCICGRSGKPRAISIPTSEENVQSSPVGVPKSSPIDNDGGIEWNCTPTKVAEVDDSRIIQTTIPGTPAEADSVCRPTVSPWGLDDRNVPLAQGLSDDGRSLTPVSSSHSPSLNTIGPFYIDEFGTVPEDQYNSATSVPFFNLCSSTMGYPTARLLKFRLNGILSVPDSNDRFS